MNPADLAQALAPPPLDDSRAAEATDLLIEGRSHEALELLDLDPTSPVADLLLDAARVVSRRGST